MRPSLPPFVVLCSFATTASAAAPISGTYSSLYYNEDGGDLLGSEVTIVHGESGCRARFQIAEGDASKVIEVPVEVHGRRISFRVPLNDEGGGRYSGTIAQKGPLAHRRGKSRLAIVRFGAGAESSISAAQKMQLLEAMPF